MIVRIFVLVAVLVSLSTRASGCYYDTGFMENPKKGAKGLLFVPLPQDTPFEDPEKLESARSQARSKVLADQRLSEWQLVGGTETEFVTRFIPERKINLVLTVSDLPDFKQWKPYEIRRISDQSGLFLAIIEQVETDGQIRDGQTVEQWRDLVLRELSVPPPKLSTWSKAARLVSRWRCCRQESGLSRRRRALEPCFFPGDEAVRVTDFCYLRGAESLTLQFATMGGGQDSGDVRLELPLAAEPGSGEDIDSSSDEWGFGEITDV